MLNQIRFVLLLLVIALSDLSFSEILSNNRRIDWKPGIQGNFPVKSDTVYIGDFGAVGDGITDDYPALSSAIDALPSEGGLVWIEPGNYLLTNTLRLDRGIMLHGEGPDKTHLIFNLANQDTNCIEIIQYGRGDWIDVLSGYHKDSNALVVDDISPFSSGEFIEIQQENDPVIMNLYPSWNEWWAQNVVGQILTISAINGDTIKVEPTLHLQYADFLNPVVRTQYLVQYAGIEKIHLKRVDSGDGYTIQIKNAAYCRIKDIESESASSAHVHLETCFGCEIRDSYFHHAQEYTGGHGYGIVCTSHSTDNIIENNIFYQLRHSFLLYIGSSGNVFGYNYSTEPHEQDTWIPTDILLNGFYANFNLIESNVMQQIDISGYDGGPAGPGNTFFRNKIEMRDLTISSHSHSQNIIGNVFSQGWNTIYIESSVDSTLIHGNTIREKVEWDMNIVDQDIPASYYLDEKPTFFGEKPWPLFGPYLDYEDLLPAQERFETPQTDADSDGLSVHHQDRQLQLAVYPNPFNPVTTIRYFLPERSHVTIQIFNTRGQLIKTVIDQLQEKGEKQMVWKPNRLDDLNVASGLYIIQLVTSQSRISDKVLFLK